MTEGRLRANEGRSPITERCQGAAGRANGLQLTAYVLDGHRTGVAEGTR